MLWAPSASIVINFQSENECEQKQEFNFDFDVENSEIENDDRQLSSNSFH